MNGVESGKPIPPQEGGQTSEQRIQELEAQNAELNYRKYFATIDKENPETIEMIEKMETALDEFLFQIRCLAKPLQDLAYYNFSVKYPEMRGIADAVRLFHSPGHLVSLRRLKFDLERARQSGIMAYPAVRGLTHSGILSPEELREAVSKIVYSESIVGPYDQVLIAVETFQKLDYIIDLGPKNREAWQNKLPEVRESLKQANVVLTSLGIEPIEINFFQRMDERLATSAKYSIMISTLREYYPNATVSVDRDTIIGAFSWAYKKPDHHLWQGHRAELIVIE